MTATSPCSACTAEADHVAGDHAYAIGLADGLSKVGALLADHLCPEHRAVFDAARALHVAAGAAAAARGAK